MTPGRSHCFQSSKRHRDASTRARFSNIRETNANSRDKRAFDSKLSGIRLVLEARNSQDEIKYYMYQQGKWNTYRIIHEERERERLSLEVLSRRLETNWREEKFERINRAWLLLGCPIHRRRETLVPIRASLTAENDASPRWQQLLSFRLSLLPSSVPLTRRSEQDRAKNSSGWD